MKPSVDKPHSNINRTTTKVQHHNPEYEEKKIIRYLNMSRSKETKGQRQVMYQKQKQKQKVKSRRNKDDQTSSRRVLQKNVG